MLRPQKVLDCPLCVDEGHGQVFVYKTLFALHASDKQTLWRLLSVRAVPMRGSSLHPRTHYFPEVGHKSCEIAFLAETCSASCCVHRVSIHSCLDLAGAVAFDARNAVRKGTPAADPVVAKEQAVLS